ncbi:hypothetical protein [Bifidobacterium subtile]|nr:hypothetical protein [Bifidobacterium subtile]QOL36501.1 hypothetical protein BS3272_00305 [Bifidobacterium subtile]
MSSSVQGWLDRVRDVGAVGQDQPERVRFQPFDVPDIARMLGEDPLELFIIVLFCAWSSPELGRVIA